MLNVLTPPLQADFAKYLSFTGMCIDIYVHVMVTVSFIVVS